jgi:tripartite-type tricarboxylate transporter receptor subunit TctC
MSVILTTAHPTEALPDIPTVGKFVSGYEASQWYGIGAPRSTPAEIIEKLNKQINACLADPAMKVRFADVGGLAIPMSVAEFEKFVVEETEKWGKVVKFAGLKAD